MKTSFFDKTINEIFKHKKLIFMLWRENSRNFCENFDPFRVERFVVHEKRKKKNEIWKKKKKKNWDSKRKKNKENSFEQFRRKLADVDLLSFRTKKIDWEILVDSSILTKINQRRILSKTMSSFFRALRQRRKKLKRCYQLSRNHNEL
jgi:hypothetical protein